MPLTGADLIRPRGELADGLLTAVGENRTPVAVTGGTVAAGYAEAGVAAVAAWGALPVLPVTADLAAAWYAYAGVLSERAEQILAGAMSAQAAGEGGESYSPAQAAQLNASAAAWRAKYDAARAAAVTPAVASGGRAAFGSRSTRAKVVY